MKLLILLLLLTFNVSANYPVMQGGGINQWETGKPYAVDTIVWDNFDFYRVLNAHTSGVLATDRTAGDIEKMIDPNDYMVGLTGNIQDQFDAQGILIGNNTTAIGVNAGNIATNTTDIGNNTTNITNNTTDIGTNATNIGINTTAIGVNAGNISTNATNIGTNATDISNHVADTLNPHAVTQTQVGLGNVDNTSDADKPVSTAQQTALDLKADQDLGNLTATSINQSLIADNNLIRDLGGALNFWNNIYGVSLELKNSSDVLIGRVKANTSSLDLRTLKEDIPIGITTWDNGAGNSGGINLTVGTATGTRGSISLDGLEVDVNSTKIVNLSDPVIGTDAANKDYVDSNSGAGTGINILDNSGFESGIDQGWLYTAGKVVELNSGSQLNRNKSARFDPSLVGEFIVSSAYTLQNDLIGTSCQASIYYKGGGPELSLRVKDANAFNLAVLELPTHTVAAYESVFFLCPNATAIGGDANKGIVQLEVYQNGGADAPAIDLDLMHLGSNQNLIETTSPDTCTAHINSVGVLQTESGGCIDSVVHAGTGRYDINFKSGFYTIAPSVTATSGTSDNCFASINILPTTSTFRVSTECDIGSGAAGAVNQDIFVNIQKQGVDALQKIQVYKSIPKVAQNSNRFSGKIAGATITTNCTTATCTMYRGNPDASIFGTITRNSVAYYTLALNGLTSPPNCTASSSSTGFPVRVFGETNTEISFYHQNNASGGGSIDGIINFECEKTGADFKMPIEQPIIVGQVRNSAAESNQRSVAVESCQINNTGAATVDTDSGLCESWIDSVTRTSAGAVTVNYKAGTFSKKPNCVVSGYGTNAANCFVGAFTAPTVNGINILCENSTTSGDADLWFWLVCQGVK